MSEFVLNDFSAGWCPSDDLTGGRKNALLQMDSLELDQNGVVRLCGGTSRVNSAYANTLHSLASRFLGSGQFIYAGDTAGNIFRNATNIGSGGSTVKAAFGSAFDFFIIMSGNKRVRDDGTTTTALGQGTASTPAAGGPVAGPLTGSYDYIQINVFNQGAYQARSAPSGIAQYVALNNAPTITPTAPVGLQNEVWIFRRSTPGTSGLLPTYYRIKRITSSYTTPFTDTVTDIDAISLGISANLAALPVDSTNLPDPILEIVGPVNSRMLLFTKNTLYATEPNSPESYVPGQGIFFMGSATTSEIFLWARKVGNNVVLVGTTHDVYRVTGTMITMPDGTLDISIRPLGVDAQPISADCDIYDGQVVYMSPYGWVLCDINGTITQLCAPNTDRLYRGNSTYGYGGVPIAILPQIRYCCAVIRNKLYVRVPEIVNNNPANANTFRLEVFDFVRKYWRPWRFPGSNAPSLLFGAEDDSLFGYFDNDKFVKYVDYQFSKQLDNGPATNQSLSFYSVFNDFGTPLQRKDLFTIKGRIYTGGSNLTLNIFINDDPNTIVASTVLNAGAIVQFTVDMLSGGLPLVIKNIAIQLSGQVADFELIDFVFEYEDRPKQLTSYFLKRLEVSSLKGQRFRPRVWPIIIDTLGQNVTFQPYIDGVALNPVTINTNGKKTALYLFNQDAFGIDLSCLLYGNIFELYEIVPPDVVQVYPLQRVYHQFGPIQVFGTGVIRRLAFRAIAFSGGSATINWQLFKDDISVASGFFTFGNATESVSFANVPRFDGNNSGGIFRIEIGIPAFAFCPIAMQLQIARSGSQNDTENEWLDFDIEKKQ